MHAGLVLFDATVGHMLLKKGINERRASTYASRAQVKSVGKAIEVLETLMETRAAYPALVEETVRQALGASNVVGYGLMLFICDAHATKNPAPKGQ